jgi:hexosaminidase
MFLAGVLAGAQTNTISVIPIPQKLEVLSGEFKLTPATRVVVDGESAITGEYLAQQLRLPTGYPIPIETNGAASVISVIRFAIKSADKTFGSEGYQLIVESNAVLITAETDAGLFYGAQTLLQLLPPQIFSTKRTNDVAWQIPCVRIEDQPRFRWRGFMLDVSRHFFGKEEIKRVLDLMALHKLNTFHWHLTDDQGWRIEIKKYPKLTKVGAWRTYSRIAPPREDVANLERDNAHPAWADAPAGAFGADGRYGGFYTQEEIREIVAYAATRHITVIPEIEMPGHAVAALAAYPELSCDHGSYNTDVNAGINKGVFCVGDEEVIAFLDNVLLEVFQLFPGKYIHLGGDEVNAAVKKATWGKCASCQKRMKTLGLKNEDELQNWFVGQMEKFVRAHGKTLVGWTEIVEGGLVRNAVVMDWRGGAMEAATNNEDVVMSPSRLCYLDYYQSLDHGAEPHAIGGFLPLERIYSFDPIPASLAPEFQSHILGGQANLWTEYIASLPFVEYMSFPRLCALAEVDWSAKDSRDWGSFSERLQTHYLRLDELGVNHRRDTSVKIGAWKPDQLTTNVSGTNLEWDITPLVAAAGEYRYTFEFDRGVGLTISSVSLLEQGREVAQDSHAGFAGHRSKKPVYVLRLAARKEGADYRLRTSVAGGDSFGEVSAVFKPAETASIP